MITVPTTMADAVAQIDRLHSRLDGYRTQLDNTFDLLQTATRLNGRLGTELRETAKELESVRVERDYWRSQARGHA